MVSKQLLLPQIAHSNFVLLGLAIADVAYVLACVTILIADRHILSISSQEQICEEIKKAVKNIKIPILN